MRVKVTKTRNQDRRGFTALEVILALAVTGLIGVCLCAMLGASTSIWGQQQRSSVGVTSGARAQAYIERLLRRAQDVGYWSSGPTADPPAMLLWAHDLLSKLDPALRDHQIQGCELLLLKYDSAGKRLLLYKPIDWDAMSSAEQDDADDRITTIAFGEKATAEGFLAETWVEEHALAGAVPGEQVTAVWWDVDRESSNPIVRLRLELLRNGQAHTIYATVSLRVHSEGDDWTEQVLEKGEDSGDEEEDLFD